MRRFLIPLLAVLFLGLGLAAAPTLAQERRGDHDQAREAVARRDAIPFAQILDTALRTVPGEVLEVDLERDDGRLLYEVEILARNGRVRTVILDARTGRVLEVEDDD